MAPCLLVKVVHVLCDYLHVKILLELSKYPVAVIGLCLLELCPEVVVEVGHQFGIAIPALNARNILNTVSLPQSAGITESLEPALCTYARTSQNNKPLHKALSPCIITYGWLNDNTKFFSRRRITIAHKGDHDIPETFCQFTAQDRECCAEFTLPNEGNA